MEEKEVLKKLRSGEEDALVWVIDHYAAYVHTIVYNILGSADAQDVEADVFYTLWTCARRIQSGKLKAFLGGIARNKAKEALRGMGREAALEEDLLLIAADDVEKTLSAREQALFLRKAVLQMQHPDREIFVRHYYYCQPVAQIAQEMGFTVSTVKTRLHRGRSKLKAVLEKGGYFVENKDF